MTAVGDVDIGRRAAVRRAAQHAKAAGCEWLGVDFTDELRSFDLDSCGFQSPQGVGLINLYQLRATP